MLLRVNCMYKKNVISIFFLIFSFFGLTSSDSRDSSCEIVDRQTFDKNKNLQDLMPFLSFVAVVPLATAVNSVTKDCLRSYSINKSLSNVINSTGLSNDDRVLAQAKKEAFNQSYSLSSVVMTYASSIGSAFFMYKGALGVVNGDMYEGLESIGYGIGLGQAAMYASGKSSLSLSKAEENAREIGRQVLEAQERGQQNILHHANATRDAIPLATAVVVVVPVE